MVRYKVRYRVRYMVSYRARSRVGFFLRWAIMEDCRIQFITSLYRKKNLLSTAGNRSVLVWTYSP